MIVDFWGKKNKNPPKSGKKLLIQIFQFKIDFR